MEKEKSLNAIEHIPSIKEKADWALRWINDKNSPGCNRIIGFAAVKVFAFGAFCSIYAVKKEKVLCLVYVIVMN